MIHDIEFRYMKNLILIWLRKLVLIEIKTNIDNWGIISTMNQLKMIHKTAKEGYDYSPVDMVTKHISFKGSTCK